MPLFNNYSGVKYNNSGRLQGNNIKANKKRTQFVSFVYVFGIIQLFFMQLKKPSVFNEEDDMPTGADIAKNNGGLIVCAVMLVFLIMFSLNDGSKNNNKKNISQLSTLTKNIS